MKLVAPLAIICALIISGCGGVERPSKDCVREWSRQTCIWHEEHEGPSVYNGFQSR